MTDNSSRCSKKVTSLDKNTTNINENFTKFGKKITKFHEFKKILAKLRGYLACKNHYISGNSLHLPRNSLVFASLRNKTYVLKMCVTVPIRFGYHATKIINSELRILLRAYGSL